MNNVIVLLSALPRATAGYLWQDEMREQRFVLIAPNGKTLEGYLCLSEQYSAGSCCRKPRGECLWELEWEMYNTKYRRDKKNTGKVPTSRGRTFTYRLVRHYHGQAFFVAVCCGFCSSIHSSVVSSKHSKFNLKMRSRSNGTARHGTARDGTGRDGY